MKEKQQTAVENKKEKIFKEELFKNIQRKRYDKGKQSKKWKLN